jgi:hypothetical protein
MLFLSSFVDYSWEPKEAPKDPEQNLHENRLRHGVRRNVSDAVFTKAIQGSSGGS